MYKLILNSSPVEMQIYLSNDNQNFNPGRDAISLQLPAKTVIVVAYLKMSH